MTQHSWLSFSNNYWMLNHSLDNSVRLLLYGLLLPTICIGEIFNFVRRGDILLQLWL
ncbi:MAG: hypothetical protein WBA39_20020 [Rivularia sp. (in: cyanobacteria)]